MTSYTTIGVNSAKYCTLVLPVGAGAGSSYSPVLVVEPILGVDLIAFSIQVFISAVNPAENVIFSQKASWMFQIASASLPVLPVANIPSLTASYITGSTPAGLDSLKLNLSLIFQIMVITSNFYAFSPPAFSIYWPIAESPD